MMLSRILRSPLCSILLFLASLGLLYQLQLLHDVSQNEANFSAMKIAILVASAAVWSIWTVLVNIHNSNHPADRIPLSGFIPAEFREVDEGQQWITYKACRNVYIYFTFAIPAAAFMSVVVPGFSSYALALFGAVGLGQYAVYGLTVWRLSRL